jgi:selenide,water dikinase
VEDAEPKFGLAVTGSVHPDRVLTNRTARVGDVLILTKPIGLGILSTAAKRGAAGKDAVERGTAVMAELNAGAAEVMTGFPVSACTDVTGFGLVGHLLEMTTGSAVTAELLFDRVPVLPGTLDLAIAGMVPGGSRDNLAHTTGRVEWSEELAEVQKLLMCDAQTSGGLLISIPEPDSGELLAQLHESGIEDAAVIGRIVAEGSGTITVVLI